MLDVRTSLSPHFLLSLQDVKDNNFSLLNIACLLRIGRGNICNLLCAPDISFKMAFCLTYYIKASSPKMFVIVVKVQVLSKVFNDFIKSTPKSLCLRNEFDLIHGQIT